MMTQKRRNLLPSHFLLLGLLYQQPSHGYELYRKVSEERDLGDIWGLKMSNLYAQLDSLEGRGLIMGTQLPGESRPAKRQYVLTGEGQELFENWLGSAVDRPRDFRPDFLLKLHFTRMYLGATAEHELLERQLTECHSWLQDGNVTEQMAPDKLGTFVLLESYRKAIIQAQITWLEDLALPKYKY